MGIVKKVKIAQYRAIIVEVLINTEHILTSLNIEFTFFLDY